MEDPEDVEDLHSACVALGRLTQLQQLSVDDVSSRRHTCVCTLLLRTADSLTNTNEQELMDKGPEDVEDLHSACVALGRLTQLQLAAGHSADAATMEGLDEKFEASPVL